MQDIIIDENTKLIVVKLKDIKINPANPRILKDKNFKALVKSVKDFDKMLSVREIVIDENNLIIGGNQRYRALLETGIEEVRVKQILNYTEDEKRELAIKDNVSSGEWSEEIFNWDSEELENWGLDLEPKVSKEIKSEEDTPPEVQGQAKTIKGDIYEFKANRTTHRVMCGDSTMIDKVEKLMDGKMADLLHTDPPYNVAYEGKTKDKLKIDNDSMGSEDFRVFLSTVFTNCYSVMNCGASFYIYHADSEGLNFRGGVLDANLTLKQCLVWNKSSIVMGRQDYHWKHEPILYGWKEGASHSWYTDRKQTTVIEFDRPNRNAEHPTMKPIELCAYLIKNSSKVGDLVLDLFGGSGSTSIACLQTKRNSNLMEIDEKYCDVIIKRLRNYCNDNQIEWSCARNGEEFTQELKELGYDKNH